MNRTGNSFRNMGVSGLFMILTYILTFYSRSVLINTIGKELVGLNSTIVDILGFLNLAELGIVSAVSGFLYTEIYKNDKHAINKLLSVFGYWYKIIGLSILGISIIFSFFLPIVFKNVLISIIDIYACYYCFLFTTLLGYFVNYTQTLLVADQKEYLVTSVTNFFLIVKLILQIILLTYLQSYIIYLLCEILFSVLYSSCINKIVKKKYSWINVDLKTGRNISKEYALLVKKIKYIIPHKVSAFVQYQSANIIIYSFTSLSVVTIYANYTLILMKGVSFLKLAFNGTIAGIGNLIAENNTDKILSVFKEYNSLFYYLGGVVVVCLYYFTPPFILLWLGDGYLLEKSTFLILLFNVYINITRNAVMFFMGAFVLYEDIYAPIIEACITIFGSILFGMYFGIFGVILGSSVSLLFVIAIWKPYYLFKKSFKISVKVYWFDSIKYMIILLISIYISSMLEILFPKPNSVETLLLYSILVFVSSSVSYAVLLLLTDCSFRNLTKRVIYLVKL